MKEGTSSAPSDSAELLRRTDSLAEKTNSTEQLNTSSSANTSEGPDDPFGHRIPWAESHWHWSKAAKEVRFGPNDGKAQGRLDDPKDVTKSLGTSADMIKAVDTHPGVPITFDMNGLNNEKILRDAEYVAGGKWTWTAASKGWGGHAVPMWKGVGNGIAPVTKYYHAIWSNKGSHRPSAYESDFFRDNSEYFGPFRLDYHTKTVYLDDWNMRVYTKDNFTMGKGNVAVGPGQYFGHAANSFIAGRHGNVRGNNVVTLGGFDNLAKADYDFVAGGAGNIAGSEAATAIGGYHNQALGKFSSSVGGIRNARRGSLLGHAWGKRE